MATPFEEQVKIEYLESLDAHDQAVSGINELIRASLANGRRINLEGYPIQGTTHGSNAVAAIFFQIVSGSDDRLLPSPTGTGGSDFVARQIITIPERSRSARDPKVQEEALTMPLYEADDEPRMSAVLNWVYALVGSKSITSELRTAVNQKGIGALNDPGLYEKHQLFELLSKIQDKGSVAAEFVVAVLRLAQVQQNFIDGLVTIRDVNFAKALFLSRYSELIKEWIIPETVDIEVVEEDSSAVSSEVLLAGHDKMPRFETLSEELQPTAQRIWQAIFIEDKKIVVGEKEVILDSNIGFCIYTLYFAQKRLSYEEIILIVKEVFCTDITNDQVAAAFNNFGGSTKLRQNFELVNKVRYYDPIGTETERALILSNSEFVVKQEPDVLVFDIKTLREISAAKTFLAERGIRFDGMISPLVMVLILRTVEQRALPYVTTETLRETIPYFENNPDKAKGALSNAVKALERAGYRLARGANNRIFIISRDDVFLMVDDKVKYDFKHLMQLCDDNEIIFNRILSLTIGGSSAREIISKFSQLGITKRFREPEMKVRISRLIQAGTLLQWVNARAKLEDQPLTVVKSDRNQKIDLVPMKGSDVSAQIPDRIREISIILSELGLPTDEWLSKILLTIFNAHAESFRD